MRCRPGDLAVVVNDDKEPRNNGALVRVLAVANPAEYLAPADWDCEAVSMIRLGSQKFFEGEQGFGYLDRDLQPIRNPGDDAVDETLIWKPVPMKETV